MLLHVWYKILPENSSDVANIAFAMRQLSNIVNKILIHLKYLTSYKNDYRIKVSKIEELILHHHIDQKPSMGYSRRKGEQQTYHLFREVTLFKNSSEQVATPYTHSDIRFTTRKDIQLKMEVIKLLQNRESDDPMSCPQRTVRTEGLIDIPLSDIDTSDTDILKEPKATPVLSSRDRVEVEIANALALDLKKILDTNVWVLP